MGWKETLNKTKVAEARSSGLEEFELVLVEEKKSQNGKDMLLFVFSKGKHELKQTAVINPDSGEFYGFSEDFFNDLQEIFGVGQEKLGDVLENAITTKKLFYIQKHREPYIKDDGSIGFGGRIFKILGEMPNDEIANGWLEKADNHSLKLLKSFEKKEETTPESEPTPNDDDDFDF